MLLGILIGLAWRVESFKLKNFDLDLGNFLQNFKDGTSRRFRRAMPHGKIITVDCTRGLDQASSNDWKHLVFPDFPDMLYKPIKCNWKIAASPATYIQVVVKDLALPCAGGNKVIIKDLSGTTKPICGKKPPPITSTTNNLDFYVTVNKPGAKGVRINIGFIQRDTKQGWTVPEFNKGKKAPSSSRMDSAGRLARKPGTPPKLRPIKPAGQAPQQPQQPQQSPQAPQGAPKGPPKGPGKKGPPRGLPPKPTVPQPKYDPNVGVGRNFRHTTKHGTADRWEVIDRRPILIGGGVVFLFLILGVAFYIGKLMKKDQIEQLKMAAEKKEAPKFKIPPPQGPTEVPIVKTEDLAKMESVDSSTTDTTVNSEKPII